MLLGENKNVYGEAFTNTCFMIGAANTYTDSILHTFIGSKEQKVFFVSLMIVLTLFRSICSKQERTVATGGGAPRSIEKS